MVSVGGGLALAGMRPIVHTYAPFLVERAYEQVKLDLAHQGARRAGQHRGSYDAPGRPTHQAPEDVALLDSVPVLVVVPAPGRGGSAAARGRGCAGRWLYLSAAVDRDQLEARPVSLRCR